MLFQNFENNITAKDNSNPGRQHARLHLRRQPQHAAADDPAPLADPRRLLVPQGRRGAATTTSRSAAEMLKSHYGGFFIPTLYGVLHTSTTRSRARTAWTPTSTAIADTFTGSAGTNEADDNWTYVAGYVQDDWKPTPRLTLNLGLRYEMQTGPLHQRVPDAVGKAALGPPGFTTRAQARQEQLRAARRLRLRRARATASSWSAAATASTTTRSSRTSRCTRPGPTRRRR